MSIYQHFRKEEHDFVDKIIEFRDTVKDQFVYKLTDFLDPRQQEIVKQVIGSDHELGMKFWGGTEQCERKRVILYPSYMDPDESDLSITLFEIIYPEKFITITHRNVLGSLMSLGLRREKFGDILIAGNKVQLIVASEIADFVSVNFQKIGNATIRLEARSFSEAIEIVHHWKEISGTVSSLRVDAIIAEAYNLSRQKVLPLIKGGNLKINWKVVEQPSFTCQIGDVLSVRGLGRCKIVSIEGKTKKDKWRIVVGLQK